MRYHRILALLLSLVLVLGTVIGCAGSTKNQALEHINQGNALESQGKYDEAIAEYNMAIELDPNNALAYNYRGVAYKDKGDYDQALADFNKAIELDPQDQRAYANRVAVNQLINLADITIPVDGEGIQTKTLTGEWVNGSPVWGFIMNDQGDPIYDAGSTWTYDVVLKLEETAQNTFTGTMQRTLREIRGPVTTVPEIMQWIGNTETASVSGMRNGSTVELYFGDLTLHLSFNSDSYGDYLQGDTYFYDTGSPVGQYKGLTDVRPSTGEYITWIYSIFLKRK